MLRRILLFIFFLTLASGDVNKREKDSQKKQMVGVDTSHQIKIDKDTIITRNLKLDKRNRGETVKARKKIEEDREPDWSYSPVPKEVSEHVAQFKKNMTECLKEVQNNDKRPVKRISPKMESPVHGECLIACVLKRNGVIHNGKINKDHLITLVSKFYSKDTKLMKKLEKNVDRCIELSVRYKDECQLASHLNECTNDLMVSNKHKITVNY